MREEYAETAERGLGLLQRFIGVPREKEKNICKNRMMR
jgi:hypothetical protein